MLSPGDGIAIASIIGGVIIWMIRTGGSKKNGNGVTKNDCDRRSGSIVDKIDELKKDSKEMDEKLWGKVDEVGKTTTKILIKIGGN